MIRLKPLHACPGTQRSEVVRCGSGTTVSDVTQENRDLASAQQRFVPQRTRGTPPNALHEARAIAYKAA